MGYDEKLFLSLAEQVKLPFIQIAHAAELLETDPAQSDIIRHVSESALSLIDGLLLHASLQKQAELSYGSVPISSLLYDAAASLSGYAASKGCEIELDVRGKCGPAYTHPEAVSLAIKNLGYSFIDAVSGFKKRTITLSLRRVNRGLAVGVYAETPQLTSELLKRARALQSESHQPLAGFTSTNGAGIFVADGLLASVGTDMHISRRGQLRGMAAVLTPSRQLSLV